MCVNDLSINYTYTLTLNGVITVVLNKSLTVRLSFKQWLSSVQQNDSQSNIFSYG